MKPARFDYLRALDVEECLEALARDGADARVIAGGQSLGAMLNMRLVTPRVLVDINRIDELHRLCVDGTRVEIGAACTQARAMAYPALAAATPLVALALPHVGHYQTRGRGTVCGSIAHADPSAELPLCLVTLEGEVVLAGRKQTRVVPADEFFHAALATARLDHELVVAVRFPVAPRGQRSAFHEVSMRKGDFALVAVAALGDARGVTLGIGGVADRPRRFRIDAVDAASIEDALARIAAELPIDGDHHASAHYRRRLVRRIGLKAALEVTA